MSRGYTRGEIIKSGMEVGVFIIASGLTEREAYDRESREIALFGMHRLTNLPTGLAAVEPNQRAGLLGALADVNYLLRWHPSKQQHHDHVVQKHGRPPTLEERRRWLEELVRYHRLRVTITALLEDRQPALFPAELLPGLPARTKVVTQFQVCQPSCHPRLIDLFAASTVVASMCRQVSTSQLRAITPRNRLISSAARQRISSDSLFWSASENGRAD